MDKTLPEQVSEPSRQRSLAQPGWRAALLWGFGATLLHRLLLGAWLAGVWLVMSPFLEDPNVNFHDPGGDLPALMSPAEGLLFGVWRRWDAVHYLNLATYGYRAEYPGPTVFGALPPAMFRLFDAVLPGEIDLGALVAQTLVFGLALALLYRVVEVYYGDVELAPWAVAALALAPLSYVFAAPLSETIYLACTLGVFFFGAKGRWWAAALCGFLATLARTQGVLLLGIAGLLLLEQVLRDESTWRARLRETIRRGWTLALIPLAAVAFTVWRGSLGLPPIDQVYAESSYVFFVNPVEGLLLNLRYIAQNPDSLLRNLDMLAIPVGYGLALLTLIVRKHRRLPLLAYTFGFLLVFGSKMNWQWGSDVVTNTQSFARYTVVLFPLVVLVADGLRRGGFWVRIGGVGLLLLSLLALSGLQVLALTGP